MAIMDVSSNNNNNDVYLHSHCLSIDTTASPSSPLPSPPMHHQFLPHHNVVEYEGLKGRASDYDFFDDYENDNVASCFRSHEQQRWGGDGAAAAVPAAGEHKVSSTKKRGGGSWLLGFARIRSTMEEDNANCHTSETSPDTDMVVSGVPQLIRSASNSSLESDESDVLSFSQHSTSSSASNTSARKIKKGVSFNESVKVLPVPHANHLSSLQKKKIFSTSLEVRANKIRNKREYRYDGYDWRNATEEWEMSVCMITGELVHPVHSVCH